MQFALFRPIYIIRLFFLRKIILIYQESFFLGLHNFVRVTMILLNILVSLDLYTCLSLLGQCTSNF